MMIEVDYVVWGTIAAVEAEYGLPDMGADWFKRWGFRYAVKIIGSAEWDVEFATNKVDARTLAKETAAALNTRVCGIA
jgi:hypothetical protein